MVSQFNTSDWSYLLEGELYTDAVGGMGYLFAYDSAANAGTTKNVVYGWASGGTYTSTPLTIGTLTTN